MVNPLGALRAARARKIAAGWLVVATIAVVAALPHRWDGGYGARGSFIPLRPPTVPEAAVLIKCDWARVIGLTPDFVYVSTRIYLQSRTPLLLPSGALRCPDSSVEVRGVDKGGTEVDYRLVHRADRAAVERLLGRPLTAAIVSPAKGFTSYVSYRWWLFAAGDALFIAFFYTILTLILRQIRRPSSWFALPAIICAFNLAWLFGRLAYSPASVLGGSAYYHRVLIEEGPWPYLSWFLPVWVDSSNVIVATAGVGMVILGLARIREWIPVVRHVRPFHYWTPIAAAIGASVLLSIFVANRGFEIDRCNARKTIDAVVSLFPDVESVIVGDQAMRPRIGTVSLNQLGYTPDWNILASGRLRATTTDAVRRLLDLGSEHERLSIYIRTGAEAFATVVSAPRQNRWVKVGPLRQYVGEHGWTEDGNANLIDAMLGQPRDYSQPFFGYAFRTHREGGLLRRRDGTVIGAAIVQEETASPRLRSLARWVCGFQCSVVDW